MRFKSNSKVSQSIAGRITVQALNNSIKELGRAGLDCWTPLVALLMQALPLAEMLIDRTPNDEPIEDVKPAVESKPEAVRTETPVKMIEKAKAENDIEKADGLFLTWLASRKRVTTAACKDWGASNEQLHRLLGMGRIERAGKGFALAGHAEAEKAGKPLNCNMPGDLVLHDAHVSAFAVASTVKASKPVKEKASKLDKGLAAARENKVETADRLAELKAEAKALKVKGGHLYKDADKLAAVIATVKGESKPASSIAAILPPAVKASKPEVVKAGLLETASTADIMAELARRLKTVHQQERAGLLLMELKSHFGV